MFTKHRGYIMRQAQLASTRIRCIKKLLSPSDKFKEHPITESAAGLVSRTRAEISAILNNEDDRLLVIIGPCSIHDVKVAEQYAQSLLTLKTKLNKELLIVMRVYLEKPRTSLGWKGLINDPNLNGTYEIDLGFSMARSLLLSLNNMGMPAATEFLNPISINYLSDLVSWGGIGARTAESQIHREFASGLPCPVGFKNNIDGNLSPAIKAILTAKSSHHFLSITDEGCSAVIESMGNSDCHLILRGGKKPNFSNECVIEACEKLNEVGLREKIMVDFSHGNCSNDYRYQMNVGRDISEQLKNGEKRLLGVMIESNLVEGNQKLNSATSLTYGQSITDACIGWSDSVILLEMLANAVTARRSLGSAANNMERAEKVNVG